MRYLYFMAICLTLSFTGCRKSDSVTTYNVVVYGGTSGGIAAAVQAKRMGKSVILIEPSSRIGGLTTGGLGQTDIGNKAAIGGISREFYELIKQYYDDPANWKWQKREEYVDGGQPEPKRGRFLCGRLSHPQHFQCMKHS